MIRELSLLGGLLGCVISVSSCKKSSEETPVRMETKAEKKKDATAPKPAKITVYSYRDHPADRRIFDRFAKDHGVEVELIRADADELLDRLAKEGKQSEADLLILSDIGRVLAAHERGLLRPSDSELLKQVVPSHLRAPDGSWVALSRRIRAIVVDKRHVDPKEISRYSDLADPKWRGQVLMRSSTSTYNRSLVAWMIAEHGPENARKWVEGAVANLARQPEGNDRGQLEAAASGIGRIAVANAHYVAQLKEHEKAERRAVVEHLVPIFPEKTDGGTPINITGAGLTAATDAPELATKLLETLLTPAAQAEYAGANYEWTISADGKVGPTLAGWGPIEASKLPLHELGPHLEAATNLMQAAGWP